MVPLPTIFNFKSKLVSISVGLFMIVKGAMLLGLGSLNKFWRSNSIFNLFSNPIMSSLIFMCQFYSMDCYFRQYWRDSRLSFRQNYFHLSTYFLKNLGYRNVFGLLKLTRLYLVFSSGLNNPLSNLWL